MKNCSNCLLFKTPHCNSNGNQLAINIVTCHQPIPTIIDSAVMAEKESKMVMFEKMQDGSFSTKEGNENLQILAWDIKNWSDKTFGEYNRNPAILYHLKKEVNKLIYAWEIMLKYYDDEEKRKEGTVCTDDVKITQQDINFRSGICEEYADCFMLLLDSAAHYHLTVDALINLTRKNLEVNKKRKWGKPDKNGVVEHIKKVKASKEVDLYAAAEKYVMSNYLQSYRSAMIDFAKSPEVGEYWKHKFEEEKK